MLQVPILPLKGMLSMTTTLLLLCCFLPLPGEKKRAKTMCWQAGLLVGQAIYLVCGLVLFLLFV